MDNDNQGKKFEVKVKISTGTQIGIGIAILAVVAAGAGLAGFFVTRDIDSGTKTEKAVEAPAEAPGAFELTAPRDGATKVDYKQTFTWTLPQGGVLYDFTLSEEQTGTETLIQDITINRLTYKELKPGRTYTWKVVAKNCSGTKSSEAFTFETAGSTEWISSLGYEPVDPLIEAACGGNRACTPNDNNFTCPEMDEMWLICNGITNKCPLAPDPYDPNDPEYSQCEQMTICQCSGVPPGNEDCTDYLAPGGGFVNPCE